ncbi:MAG: hypothetical protein NVS2B16_21380 [Chloroflexota bacterium]
MEWTPVGLAEALLFHFGQFARPAALFGALALSMVAGGLAGTIRAMPGCGRSRQIAGTLVSSLFLLFVFTVVFVPGVISTALCFVLFLVVTLTLASLPRRPVSGRRKFLEQNFTVFGGAAILLSLFSVQPLLRALAVKRFFAFRAPRGLSIAGLTPLVTPTERFYQMDKVLQFPAIGPPGWSLTVDGLVDRPLQLDYGALVARHAEHRYVTMECVDNPVGGSLISTALWTGVSVKDLLRNVGARGDTVVFYSADDYREATRRDDLEKNNAMIAYAMNGERLPAAHGFPARLVVPGIYGFKSVKWLARLEVIQGPYSGNWRAHGWTESARIHTTCRVDVIRHSRGSTLLAGIAFGGNRGINAVEVRVNGGPWQRATLGPKLSHQAWVQWLIRLVGNGRAHVDVRAIDGHGVPQTGVAHGAYPDGSTGWTSVDV